MIIFIFILGIQKLLHENNLDEDQDDLDEDDLDEKFHSVFHEIF